MNEPIYGLTPFLTDGSGTTTYVYNPVTGSQTLGAGQLATETSTFTGASITYGYDALGRTIGRSINGVNDSINLDSLGRVSTRNSVLGITYFGYEGFKLTSLEHANGVYLGFSYNPSNLGAQLNGIQAGDIAYPNPGSPDPAFYEWWLSYSYDKLGRETSFGKDQFWYCWGAGGGNLPVGTQATGSFEYDAEGQLLEQSISVNGVVSQDYAYGYDAAGNRLNQQLQQGPELTESVPSGGGTISGPTTPVQASQFTYQNGNQLKARNGSGAVGVRIKGTLNELEAVTINGSAAQVFPDPSSTTGGQLFEGWTTLQQGGNSVEIQASGGSGVTLTRGIFVAGGVGVDKTYGYDNNGNCLGYTSAAGNATYSWDAENRLVSITGGYGQSQFSYDGFGRCVQIVEQTGGVTTSTKRFVWSGNNRCAELDANNNVTKRFLSEGEQISGGNYYFTFDRLGSVQEMTDANGYIQAQYSYDPYGNKTKLQGSMDADLGFAGYYVHAPSGLYLTVFRPYDPDSGRWLNQDPIQEAGGINLYQYAYNSPVNFVDPNGLLGVFAGVTGSAEAGVVATGAGATGSAGIGGFYGDGSFDGGAFASGGAFANWGSHDASAPPAPDHNNGALGAFAGAGVMVGISNAKCISDLRGPFKTYSFNAGWFAKAIGIQLSIGKNDQGKTIWTLSYSGPLGFPSGVGFGGDVSKYNTYTVTTGK